MTTATPPTEHPADFIEKAEALDHEAEKAEAKAREWSEKAKHRRGQAAAMREKARRILDEHENWRPPKAEPPDPLTAAAALAVEDLDVTWELTDLGDSLSLRDTRRLVRIVTALEEQGVIACLGKIDNVYVYRTIDPDEPRVRDAARELGTFMPPTLAEKLDVNPEHIQGYLDIGTRAGWLVVNEDGWCMYLKPGPERIITRHPRRALPEKDRPAYDLAPRNRGEAVRVINHGERGRLGSMPGQRHKLAMKDAAWEKMQTSRAQAAEAARAKAANSNPQTKRKAKRSKAA